MPIALVFPGQGSQSRGMLAALAARFPSVQRCFAEASAALDLDLWRLVTEGPVEQLNATEFTQPVMLAAGIATWRVWLEQGGAHPAAVSGHSLGEFTALVCAESLAFGPALRLVRDRGRLMQQAVPTGGAMAAILGLEDEAVEALCLEAAGHEVVEVVNFNSPGQVVIAGNSAAVDRAVELARVRGARRARRLSVSVPAHSSLMRSAAAQLQPQLAQLPIGPPRYAYFSAVDGAEHASPEDIRAILAQQLASPVRWRRTVRALFTRAPMLIECGPGKVLTGLNRRIERGASCLALEDPESLAAALRAGASEPEGLAADGNPPCGQCAPGAAGA
ncbi:MAG TPA: ACP S-malonyltransferase [Steroidobacteraceae bacterium]|nr:ACP S-malonyltransferase [Steroidobacteraceae bacterium]